MRQAVLEGLELTYTPSVIIPMPARPPLVPAVYHQGQPRPGTLPLDLAQRLATSSVRGRGMIGKLESWLRLLITSAFLLGRRDILSRGGQLEIAGVVVGQWGGSVDKNKPRGVQPQQAQLHQV